MIFSYIYKNTTQILSEKQRKASRKARERYQDNHEEEKNKKRQNAHEKNRNLFEEEKNRSNNMVANDTKTFLKMKNKGQLSIEKAILRF